jgi:hypothetical protein
VRQLASTGYNVNILDGDGYTPPVLATRQGNTAVCELLISNFEFCLIVFS